MKSSDTIDFTDFQLKSPVKHHVVFDSDTIILGLKADNTTAMRIDLYSDNKHLKPYGQDTDYYLNDDDITCDSCQSCNGSCTGYHGCGCISQHVGCNYCQGGCNSGCYTGTTTTCPGCNGCQGCDGKCDHGLCFSCSGCYGTCDGHCSHTPCIDCGASYGCGTYGCSSFGCGAAYGG